MAYDTGDKTIQCGRKVDCLKLWLMWKANGTEGLEKRVDRAFEFTRYGVGDTGVPLTPRGALVMPHDPYRWMVSLAPRLLYAHHKDQ